MSSADIARNTVDRLLAEAVDADSIEKAARAAAALHEVEKLVADTQKTVGETAKIQSELGQTQQRSKAEERKHYASLLAPLLSTLILAGTLLLQTYQAILADREKQVEQQRQRDELQRQRDAADDARWADTLKALSQEYKQISPGVVNLQTFLSSARHGELARKAAEQALSQSANAGGNANAFKDLFFLVYSPIDWKSYPKVMDLARVLYVRYYPLNVKKNSKEQMSADEEQEWDALGSKTVFLCSQIAPLLKGLRPQGAAVELRSVYWWDCDLSNANLSGADVGGFSSVRINLKGADLSNLVNYGQSFWGVRGESATAWWQAAKISPEALQYLKERFPYDEKSNYGNVVTSADEYAQAIARLAR